MKAQSRLQHLAKAGAGWVCCALGLAGQRVGAGLAVACETEAVKNGGTRPNGGTNGGTNRHFLAFLIGEIESHHADHKRQKPGTERSGLFSCLRPKIQKNILVNQ